MAVGRTYYAWSPITVLNSVRGNGAVMTISAGEKVSKNQVGEDWSNLLSAGVIRTERYPKCKSDESPQRAKLRAANEAMERAMAPFVEGDQPDDEDDLDDPGPEVTSTSGEPPKE